MTDSLSIAVHAFASHMLMSLYIYVCVCISISIYIYIVTVLAVTNSLCGFVANQVQYNLESAQYLR